MSRSFQLIAVLTVVGAAIAAPAQADGRNSVFGLWADSGSVLEISADEAGLLSAVVVAAMDPRYAEGEPGPTGEFRMDDKNPDERKRSRRLLGLELLEGYLYSGKRWEGKIYDPESGNTYSSRMRVRDGRLVMRGYIGVPMLGRTAEFDPVDRCAMAPSVLAMFERSEVATPSCNRKP